MDKILLLLGFVALFGVVQSYTLRDILRERALRRYDAYDKNEYLDAKYQREYDALRARALRTLREFHLRRMFDANFRMDEDCRDDNEHCADVIKEYKSESYDYCKDTDESIQEYVKAHCRLSCGFCVGSAPTKAPNPGGSRVCENELDKMYPAQRYCTQYESFCKYGAIKYYMGKYCYATCHPLDCPRDLY